MTPLSSLNTTTNASSSPPTATVQQRSPCHSPVPYLFGGLAAMLGLIAFALLILACSYWKLSGQLDNGEGRERDLESGVEKEGDSGKAVAVYEEKILVIMAGDEKPTFLATPVSSRASSFGDGNGKSENKEREKEQNSEKLKEKMGDHHNQSTSEGNEESQDTQETPAQNQ